MQIRCALLCCLVSLTLSGILATPESHAGGRFDLADACPPYFSLDSDGLCRLQTLYDLYPSANGQWGGYRVALPTRRDGFSPQQIDLGRLLFFDPVLSESGRMACASCHQPTHSMADARGRSLGRNETPLPRGAPSLWNLAFQDSFFWDGRADTLEAQITMVVLDENELATTPEKLVRRLSAIDEYRRLFAQVYGDKEITYQRVQRALVAFEVTLISLNSRYDAYIHGSATALNEQEINGLHVFRSFASRCSQCHTPPLFTSGELATTGVPPGDGLEYDRGAEVPTGEPSLRGSFKVPSLRNVALTAPHMHAGQAATLLDAIRFYNNPPGHAVSDRDDLRLNWHIVNPHLSPDEVLDLAAFLTTLSDETALPVVPDRVPSGLTVPIANGGSHAIETTP